VLRPLGKMHGGGGTFFWLKLLQCLRPAIAWKQCQLIIDLLLNPWPVTLAPSNSQRLLENVRCGRYPRHFAWKDCRSPISTRIGPDQKLLLL